MLFRKATLSTHKQPPSVGFPHEVLLIRPFKFYVEERQLV